MNHTALRPTTLFIFFILALGLLFTPGASMASAQGKKALLIVAKENFEQTEYSAPRKALEDAGVTCMVASTKTGTLKSNKKKRIKADMTLEEVDVSQFDAIVVIGGNGIKKVWKNEDAHRVVQDADKQGKIIGAICAGPGILAYADILKGRTATVNPKSGAQRPMKEHGCNVSGETVVIDGNLVTGNGPRASEAFGKALVQVLSGS